MQHSRKCLRTVLVCVFPLTAAVSAVATGFDLPDQDAFAIGRGMAFVATADNPSAIYYNPSGITQLPGSNARIGLYGLYIDPTYKNAAGATFDNQDNFDLVPQFYYTLTSDKCPFSFGLGAYSPFGVSSRWPQGTGFRDLATKGSLTCYTINPVTAVKVGDHLSLGAGVTVNYANLDLQQGLTPIPNADNFRFVGSGWDVGYNLGLLWQPIDQLSFGGTFRSGTTAHLGGRTEFWSKGGLIPPFPTQRVNASTDFSFPLKAILGVSYRPTTNWNFEFDADYTDWTTLGTVTVDQAAAFPPLLPQNIPIKLDWESSWYFEFGATRYLGNGWSISAGYIYNENSIPDATYNPLVADLDRHFLSVGIGHKGKRMDFDLACQLGFAPTRSVSDSPTPAGYPPSYHPADGQYGFMSHALALSVGWHF